jgi:hypothetical protein
VDAAVLAAVEIVLGTKHFIFLQSDSPPACSPILCFDLLRPTFPSGVVRLAEGGCLENNELIEKILKKRTSTVHHC